MASLQQIFEWFGRGKFPTEEQYKQTYSSYWHKSERLPKTQVLGLNEELNKKADKTDLANITSGLVPMGDAINMAELDTKPKRNNDAYFVLDQLNENGDPYIYRYDAELDQWINTKQVVYKDVAKKEDLEVKADKQEARNIEYPTYDKILELYNGAVATDDGFKIPVGQTGASSVIYQYVDIMQDVDGFISVIYDTNLDNSYIQKRISGNLTGSTEELGNNRYKHTFPVPKGTLPATVLLSFQYVEDAICTEEKYINQIEVAYYSDDMKTGLKSANQYLIEKRLDTSVNQLDAKIDSSISFTKNELSADYKDRDRIIEYANKQYFSVQVYGGAVKTDTGFKMPIGQKGTNTVIYQYVTIVPDVNGFISVIYQSNINTTSIQFRVNGSLSGTVTNIGGNKYKYVCPIPKNTYQELITLSIQYIDNIVLSEEKYLYVDEIAYYSDDTKTDLKSANQYLIEKSISKSVKEANSYTDDAIKKSKPTTTEIIVSSDENSDYPFKGNNAIQSALNSITDASETKRYRIFVLDGLYKITNSSQFNNKPNFTSLFQMKDYVDVVGQSAENTIVWAELPYKDADIDSNIARVQHQTVWNKAKKATLKNITLVAKNLRYVLHQDNPATELNTRNYENVNLVFFGDKGYKACFGTGTWNGETNYIKGGKSQSSGYAFSSHNNTNFQYSSNWHIENHAFISETQKETIQVVNSGSLVSDSITLTGCSFGIGKIIQYQQTWLKSTLELASYNHAEWRIKGYGNDPFLFKNIVRGASLRITSKSTGNNSTVRFSTVSTAYDLVANPREQYSLFVPSEEIQDKYIICDGSSDLSGYAYGCADVSDEAGVYDNGVVYTSLGKRLGDCSANNKTLIMNVDGVNYTVIFNKDYTNTSNADILTEINAVISDVAMADLHCAGGYYFPEMTDVQEICMNASDTEPIKMGTVVSMYNGRVSPCTDQKNIYGVALDDIPIYSNVQGIIKGKGRVMKKGYLVTDYRSTSENRFFVLSNKNAAYSDRFRVDNGRLVNDNENGIVTTIDENIVEINF